MSLINSSLGRLSLKKITGRARFNGHDVIENHLGKNITFDSTTADQISISTKFMYDKETGGFYKSIYTIEI